MGGLTVSSSTLVNFDLRDEQPARLNTASPQVLCSHGEAAAREESSIFPQERLSKEGALERSLGERGVEVVALSSSERGSSQVIVENYVELDVQQGAKSYDFLPQTVQGLSASRLSDISSPETFLQYVEESVAETGGAGLSKIGDVAITEKMGQGAQGSVYATENGSAIKVMLAEGYGDDEQWQSELTAEDRVLTPEMEFMLEQVEAQLIDQGYTGKCLKQEIEIARLNLTPTDLRGDAHRELEALVRLNGLGITPEVHHVFQTKIDGKIHLGIEMSKAEGSPLSELKSALSLKQFSDAFLGVVSTIERLEKEDIVHGDLSNNGNIFLNDKGEVCLIDFGLSQKNEGLYKGRDAATFALGFSNVDVEGAPQGFREAMSNLELQAISCESIHEVMNTSSFIQVMILINQGLR